MARYAFAYRAPSVVVADVGGGGGGGGGGGRGGRTSS